MSAWLVDNRLISRSFDEQFFARRSSLRPGARAKNYRFRVRASGAMQRAGELFCAGQALPRTAGALLIRGGGEGCSIGVVTGQQAALVADPELTIGELVNDDRAANEMHARRGSGKLQDHALETHGVVVMHQSLVFGRQQQVEVDSRHRRERTLGLGRGYGEAAVEVRHEDLLEVAVGLRVGGNAVE